MIGEMARIVVRKIEREKVKLRGRNKNNLLITQKLIYQFLVSSSNLMLTDSILKYIACSDSLFK